ncbi:MAG: DNA topoisomerase 1 [Candidatus Mesenet longicola]|uniref:DNA topoisomerase 1 n=1 Tax=Candidatus Mesenet longicola TaxID=1892558 RepID=A0A8J3HWA3_9RICK|nr:MAG: DNA topoisomerase 1 [Candidatus Mesenet longicola]GHM60085.1 MAG: DNA topoisomerase 1 [Candidatus Mesenet longicola]
MSILVVESPAKAKTISKYLDNKFRVVASFGHVRDLPAKNGSVDPNSDFAVKYEIIDKAEKYIKELVKAAAKTSAIYLATDPDREGEAIAWHVIEVLKEKKAITDKVQIYRIVFNEITKNAVTEAIKNPRTISMDLVNAQQARRALDYLVGFTLSPLLWRKLPGSKSAGRVQSVALRLICERENEISKFISQEYWSIEAEFLSEKNEVFFALLSHYDNKKLDKLDIKNKQEADDLVDIIKAKQYAIAKVENKQVKRNPPLPFITSSLQQEASNKLGFAVKNTMRIAQNLYEGIDIGGESVGLITYMRTDGFYIADEAINAIKQMINSIFGEKYLPKSARKYTKKVKNAQEAHEAIRPTNITKTPDSIAKFLTAEQLKLYELIWKRTVAGQMESALIDQVTVDVESQDRQVIFHATGSTIAFDGFYKVYQDSKEDESTKLPNLKEDESCELKEVISGQHFTQPPPRFNEASLVKKMEEIGIGRPSTYATIISVLQDRGYAALENKRFIPSDRGQIVTIFLTSFFSRYVEYNFTANMEEELDLISNGDIFWKEVLGKFWSPFIQNVDSIKEMENDKILDTVRTGYLFPNDIDTKCPKCEDGNLRLNIGRTGVFLGCSGYPECKYTREIKDDNNNDNQDASQSEYPKLLGLDPSSQKEVFIKKGPYGFYVQLGSESKGKKVSLLKDVDPSSVDLNFGLKMLSLPMIIGHHPETNKEIKIGIGRFGPYIFYDGKYFSLKKKDVFSVTVDEALSIITSNSSGEVKSLGCNQDGEEISVRSGKYGPYIKCGKINVALGKDFNTDEITLEKAIEMIKSKKQKKQ